MRPLELSPRDLHQLELLLDEQGHELSAERAILEDVDALSFFCVDSWYYLEQHGPLATQQPVARLLSGMSTSAICLALMTRQPSAMNGMIDRALDLAPAHSGVRHARLEPRSP